MVFGDGCSPEYTFFDSNSGNKDKETDNPFIEEFPKQEINKNYKIKQFLDIVLKSNQTDIAVPMGCDFSFQNAK